jgi:pyridoxamine 5'-phosphate oxidase
MTSKEDFSEDTIDTNPFIQFNKWYAQHLGSGILVPDSVTLATSSIDGHVSARTVLLKDYDETGFVFFTNYKSRKGLHISSNPRTALLFYWSESGRQVRVEGVTEKIAEEESESYFSTRLRESQLAAWASEQSSVIPGRHYLDDKFNYYKNIFFERPVERPSCWGGFRVVPDWFEFWQEREFRLHDRLTYTKRNNLWVIERLAP